MKNRIMTAGFSLAAIVLSVQPALAQSDPVAENQPFEERAQDDLNMIVVTGPSSEQRVLETSYGITVLDQHEILRGEPLGWLKVESGYLRDQPNSAYTSHLEHGFVLTL